MDAAPTYKKRRRWLVLAVVIVAVLATAGYTINYAFEQAKCQPLTPPGCGGGIDSPIIQHAQASTTGAEENCQFERINAISWETVCSVYVNGGDTGTINLSVTTTPSPVNGGSQVDFWAYSSLPNYINFTATPACAYTSSTPPLNGAAVCTIPATSPQTFQFVFTVSQSYGASRLREDASVTIVMDKLCCFG